MTKINLIIVLLFYICILILTTQPNLVLGFALVLLSLPALLALYLFLYRTAYDYFQSLNPTTPTAVAACQVVRFCLLTPIVITIVYNLRIIAYLVEVVAQVNLSPLHHF